MNRMEGRNVETSFVQSLKLHEVSTVAKSMYRIADRIGVNRDLGIRSGP